MCWPEISIFLMVIHDFISAEWMHDWTLHRHAVLVSNICTQHVSFCAVSADPNMNNQGLMVAEMKGVQHIHYMFVRLMHQWTRNTCVILLWGLTFVSNCVHGPVHHQHCIGARRRQIRLEQIRCKGSKTWFARMVVLESSRRTENRLVRLRSEKSSKFWN